MLKKLEHKILNSKFVINLITITKTSSFIGFDKVPIYYVANFFKEAITKGTLNTRAASVAFNFFLAIFPGILFLLTLIPFIPWEGFELELIQEINTTLPPSIAEPITSTITDLLENERQGLLIVNILMTLYFASNGIQNLMTQFNNTYLFEEKRVWWKQRLIAIFLVVILTILILTAIILISFTGYATQYAIKHGYINLETNWWLINSARWVVVFALFYFAISFLFYLGPAKRKSWKFFSVGSSVTTILIIFSSAGFSFYVGNFSQYNAIYGSVGTVILILLYFQLNSFLLLIGFELNASIRKARIENPKAISTNQ